MKMIPLILFAAFCVGTSDFLSRFVSRTHSVFYTIFFCTGVGVLFFGGLLWHDSYDFLGESAFVLQISALVGVLHLGAILCFYTAINRGPLTLASPISGLSVLILATEWHFLGISLSVLSYVAMLVIFAGAWVLSSAQNQEQSGYSRKHLILTGGFALGAAFLFATRLLILQYYREEIPVIVSMFQTRFWAFLLIFLLIVGRYFFQDAAMRQKLSLHSVRIKHDIGLPFLQAFLENIGIFLLLWASTGVYKVVAPALFSSYMLFTLFWGYVILKESFSRFALVGVLLILCGMVCMQLA